MNQNQIVKKEEKSLGKKRIKNNDKIFNNIN